MESKWRASSIVFMVLSTLNIGCFVYVVVRLRNVMDAFGFKQELLCICMVAVIAIVVFGVVLLMTRDKSISSDVGTDLLQGITVIISIVCSLLGVWRPLFLHWKEQQHKKILISCSADLDSGQKEFLELLTHNGRIFAAYKKHITNELSAENLIFWDQVGKWLVRVEASSDKALERFKEGVELCKNCILENAPLQVNVQSRVRKEAERLMRLNNDGEQEAGLAEMVQLHRLI